MAYRIVYGPVPKMVQNRRNNAFRQYLLTAAFFLLFVFLVRQAWPEGTQILRAWLLPGEPTATELAVNGLLADLRSGEPVGEAVTAFCRQIIENGQTSVN